MNINEDHIKKVAHQRRIRQQAAAILHRGKEAGIPERFIRTKKQDFKNLLCDKYHEDIGSIVDIIYDNSDRLLIIPSILIDGGNPMVRTQVGCIILFRIIACDKRGIYHRCDRLSHKLEDMKSDGTMSRNAYVDNLQDYDGMFIGEVKLASFNQYFMAGSFMDELLGFRYDNTLTTIFSFSQSLCVSNMIDSKVAGDTISSLSIREFASEDRKTNPTANVLRIRVKNI